MGKQVAKVDLRAQMPETSRFVDAKRAAWGKAHVDACIRRALAGEADQFYAVEGGHVLGVPFATALHGEVTGLAVQYGAVAVFVMRAPDGTH